MSTPTESRVGILERSATRALLAPTASATLPGSVQGVVVHARK